MRNCCLACNQRFYWREGDEDCTPHVCSICMSANPDRMAGKWARLRFKILQRDEFTCRYCGDSPLKNKACLLHVDHVIPQKNFISNSEKNLITACALCNFGKFGFEINKEAKEKLDNYLNSKEVATADDNHTKRIRND